MKHFERKQINHPIDLCLADSNPLRVKTIEFSLVKTLKINPSLSALGEEKLCNMLRENLEAFTWSYKEMREYTPQCVLTTYTSKKVESRSGNPNGV